MRPVLVRVSATPAGWSACRDRGRRRPVGAWAIFEHDDGRVVAGLIVAGSTPVFAQGGEASLTLPDLHQAVFSGIEAPTLLMVGLGGSLLGLPFCLRLYRHLQNIPVIKSMLGRAPKMILEYFDVTPDSSLEDIARDAPNHAVFAVRPA